VTLIKQRLGIEAVLTPGKTGQFEVIADGEKIAERGGSWLTRKFGAGYPDLESVVEQLAERSATKPPPDKPSQ
jgi:predicted Rdx family selenoprotein